MGSPSAGSGQARRISSPAKPPSPRSAMAPWQCPASGPAQERPLVPAESSPGICRPFYGLILGIPGAGPGLFIKFFQTYFFDFLVDQYPAFIQASIKIGSVTVPLIRDVLHIITLKTCLCCSFPMPRQSRIDAPGALHHIIARGNEKRNIFTELDRQRFIVHLGDILSHTVH